MNNQIQFPFEFTESISFAEDDFITSQANQNAFNYIQNWLSWGEGRYSKLLILYGPRSSGKTHLSHIFAKLTKAKLIQTKDLFTKHPFELALNNKFLILEDLDIIKDCEEIIFHLINEVCEQSCYLLITSKVSPTEMKFKLPDLESRIKVIPSVSIDQPDDQLIHTLLVKRFSDKQIRISNDIINYLATHIERSFKEINSVVDYIDKKSMIEKRKVTISLVKEVLDYMIEIKT